MRAVSFSLVLAAALAGCPSAPAPRPDDPGPTSAQPTPLPPDLPPLTVGGGDLRPPLEHRTLPNGLDVYLLPDHGSPLVIVQWWAKVGSGDEHEAARPGEHGTTGLSHFFEHLMFQGTKRFPSYDDALTPLGAQNNAFTYQDSTVFYAYAPKQHLRFLLDIEADRFRHMKVDFTHLEPEREVVKNERRQRTDADPGELAEERAIMRTFDRSSYKWGPIGWMTDLDAVTLEEAQSYFASHYHPGGTTMIIAGDFAPDEAMQMLTELWGDLPPNPAAAAPRAAPPAETWVGPRGDHLMLETPTTTAVWTYRAPAPAGATLREYAALELIDYILTAGKAGRLQKRLVFSEAPMLSRLGASLWALRDPYVYKWRADLLAGASVTAVEAAIDEEMTRLATDGVTPDELARAVASLRTSLVQEHLSNSGRAEAVGFSLASTGAPFSLFDRLEAYPTITPAELEAAAKKWLTPAVRSRVVVVAPSRFVALAKAWEAMTPPSPLDGSVSAAAQWFADSRALADKVADADREDRAVALLAQRADIARKTADAAERKAIDKYLSQNEMGTTKRMQRQRALRKELDAAAFELSTRRLELLKKVETIIRRSEVQVTGPKVTAITLLTAPPEELAIPVPPTAAPAGSEGLHALALQALASWVLEARGLAKSADAARAFVLAATASDTTSEAARLARELALDTRVVGLPLEDALLSAVRPTRHP